MWLTLSTKPRFFAPASFSHAPSRARCIEENSAMGYISRVIRSRVGAETRRGKRVQAPGSQTGLLPSSPLRTTRASFPACRSSLSNAPCGARWCHVERLAMDLPMTVGMQEHPVVHRIAATVGPPDGVMGMPSRQSGNFLVTKRAETVLLFPEVQQLPSSFEIVCHLHA